MKSVFDKTSPNGWTYYIDRGFAWLPMYCQGTLIWLRHFWKTWPEDKNGPIRWCDVLSGEKSTEPAYVAYYPYDPRERK